MLVRRKQGGEGGKLFILLHFGNTGCGNIVWQGGEPAWYREQSTRPRSRRPKLESPLCHLSSLGELGPVTLVQPNLPHRDDVERITWETTLSCLRSPWGDNKGVNSQRNIE